MFYYLLGAQQLVAFIAFLIMCVNLNAISARRKQNRCNTVQKTLVVCSLTSIPALVAVGLFVVFQKAGESE